MKRSIVKISSLVHRFVSLSLHRHERTSDRSLWNADRPLASMKFPIRQLPVIQNWSCHQCGNCCREYLVTVTGAEKRRIEEQGWPARPEFRGQPIFVRFGPFWRREYRLAHRGDGSCVFLDDRGLCRIHGEFGEQAKPIACQFYPYMLAPTDKELRVSVRFSCPSAVKNLGRPVTDQVDAIRRYASQLIPVEAKAPKPPPLCPGQAVEWSQLLDVVDTLERIVGCSGTPLRLRLIQAISFAKLLEQARVSRLNRSDFRELLSILAAATAETAVADVPVAQQCPGWALILFRLLVAQCARKDLSPHLRSGMRGRWGLFRAAVRFARGRGTIPRLQPHFGSVQFDTIEHSFGDLPDAAAAMLERYYRIKLSGLQFFGGAFYHTPLLEGFYSLSLTFPAILWIARWLAATAGRDRLATDDVATALTVVDHQWGFAAAFGLTYSRWRVRLLASQGHIERLILRYSN
jgi:lysine-N-methylase